MLPGEILVDDSQGEIIANAERATAVVTVSNTGDRPIQVGSHFHFFETNRALRFDRLAAYGMRLNIAAGTAVRFEPGETKPVALVALAGERVVFGHNSWVDGTLDAVGVRAHAQELAAPYSGEAAEHRE